LLKSYVAGHPGQHWKTQTSMMIFIIQVCTFVRSNSTLPTTATSQPPRFDGGASRDRTDDIQLAKLALSQLSYGPVASLASALAFANPKIGGPDKT